MEMSGEYVLPDNVALRRIRQNPRFSKLMPYFVGLTDDDFKLMDHYMVEKCVKLEESLLMKIFVEKYLIDILKNNMGVTKSIFKTFNKPPLLKVVSGVLKLSGAISTVRYKKGKQTHVYYLDDLFNELTKQGITLSDIRILNLSDNNELYKEDWELLIKLVTQFVNCHTVLLTGCHFLRKTDPKVIIPLLELPQIEYVNITSTGWATIEHCDFFKDLRDDLVCKLIIVNDYWLESGNWHVMYDTRHNKDEIVEKVKTKHYSFYGTPIYLDE